jgi:hypothetical protein
MSTPHVVAAWADVASGPGWANRLIWLLLRDADGILSLEAIQPDEQTAEMVALYAVSEAAHLSMIGAVARSSAKSWRGA